MLRWTAKILLVLTLVGTLAPIALAVSAPPQHACCLRKMRHSRGDQKTIQDVPRARGNCCPPMATAHWTEPGQFHSYYHVLLVATPVSDTYSQHLISGFDAVKSARAPPQFSIA